MHRDDGGPTSLQALDAGLPAVRGAARPFQWKFTREDLKTLLSKIPVHEKTFRKAA
jgi:hypothetical protein